MANNILTKNYAKPFILSKTKLIRIYEIVSRRFAEICNDKEIITMINVSLKNGKSRRIDNIELLFDLDNSLTNNITFLSIFWKIGQKKDDDFTFISIDYISNPCPIRRSSISLEGESPSFTWLNETFAQLEEQIDRTIPSGLIYKMRNLPSELQTLIFLFIPLLLFMITFLFINEPKISNINAQSRIILNEKYKTAITIENKIDFLFDLASKQLGVDKISKESPRHFLDVRTYFILSPILVTILIFLYLYFKCYPIYVFEWGDYEVYHAKLVERRKFLWNVIIGSLFIGIIANLFVYAVSDVYKSSM